MDSDNTREELWRLYERTRLDRQYFFKGLDSLLLPDNARIVDIGCGSGGSTQIIRECYPKAEIYGIDSSIKAIQYASTLLKDEKIVFLNTDATHMPFPDSYFDCCVAKMFFDIAIKHEEIIEEIVRILKPQGILLVYGNTRSTAQGSDLLKNTDKLISAYKRYVRLSGRKGFNVEHFVDILTKKYRMTVSVQKIIKDTIDPGREQLSKYYTLSEIEIVHCAENNILSILGLISPMDVIEYETSLRELLMTSNEYISFEQAILYAIKEGAQ